MGNSCRIFTLFNMRKSVGVSKLTQRENLLAVMKNMIKQPWNWEKVWKYFLKLNCQQWVWFAVSFRVCDYYIAFSNGCDFKYMMLGHSEFLYWFPTIYNQLIRDFTNNHKVILKTQVSLSCFIELSQVQSESKKTYLTLKNLLSLHLSVHRAHMQSEGLVSSRAVMKVCLFVYLVIFFPRNEW